MYIDYLKVVPSHHRVLLTISDYIDFKERALLKPCSYTDVFTFNDRQLTLSIGGNFAPTASIRCRDHDVNIKKDFHQTTAVWSRGEFFIPDYEKCGCITNPLRSNIMVVDENRLNSSTYSGITDETLLFVEFVAGDFLPLRVVGNAIKRVFDTWVRSEIYGFACTVNPSLEGQKLIIEGRMPDGKYAQIILTYNKGEVSLAIKNVTGENSIVQYKKMGKSKYPILPKRSGFAPNSIILTTRDISEVETLVRQSLEKYPHLEGYGDSIKGYQTDDVEWTLGIDNIAKKQLQYFDPMDINIIKINGYNDESKSDSSKIINFWENEVSWRFKMNPIRAITIIKDDVISLPIKFRKGSKLRYIDMLCPGGTIKPFITNKY